jgi:hypothetical protein
MKDTRLPGHQRSGFERSVVVRMVTGGERHWCPVKLGSETDPVLGTKLRAKVCGWFLLSCPGPGT